MDHRKFAWDFVAEWYTESQSAAFRRLMALGRYDLILAMDEIRNEGDSALWACLKERIERLADRVADRAKEKS